ncbi:transmembrane 7 superfamily member 3 [Ochotona curzoniae]|uniref:transmembrane 7 superfamily member 3 n=1 Tax=Ochotona curzoniae TaxID=130825 RepID=UPI001B347AB3|nr:transmembrane 7 superfamily member 3 [Ochotona curzoniae]
MGLAWLLALALLASAAGAEVVADASQDLLEFSVGKFRSFELNRTLPKEAVVRNIFNNVTLLIFQIHSQYRNTTVSFSRTLLPGSSATGTDQGLAFVMNLEQTLCTWYLETTAVVPVRSVAIPLSYSELDPVPGGCNLEFDLDIDPNIYVEYDFFETTLKFAPANLGYSRGTDPLPCDVETSRDSRWRLQYDIYQYFLPENDLSEQVLLQALQRMAEVSQVKANAVKVITLTANDKTDISFSSVRGQGVIYNIIVRDPLLNSSAAYVPAHTYACSFEAVEGNCASLGRASTKAFFTLFALLGLFICFFGHRFWKTELFFIGFIIMGFFFYILLARLTAVQYDVRLILTAVAGGVGGLVLMAAWWRFGVLPLCMLCVGLTLGALISSMTLFTPLGNLKIFRDDGVFWVAFCCIAVFIPALCIGCLRILNVLSCGVVGSYTVVLAINSYSFTSLSHVTLNILKRALRPDFRRAFTKVPWQTTDFIILAVWGMLAVSGITLQIRRERGRPFFPPHPYKLWKQERERRVTNVLDPSHHLPPLRERLLSRLAQIKELFRKEQPAGERTPLLL